MMRPWLFGNTTVRSPFRLRDGLIAIKDAGLEGRLSGQENELRLCEVLDERDVISWSKTDVTYSIGRKWRAAMTQLGFLYPSGVDNAFAISANGKRLMESESVAAWNECFLRSLAAYQIPSEKESDYDFTPFSPLQYVLNILLNLSGEDSSGYLSPMEIAIIIQFSSPDTPLNETIENIRRLRIERKSVLSKRSFDSAKRREASESLGYAESTFADYSDVNIRYLKATGLVLAKGRGIAIAPQKLSLIKALVADEYQPKAGIDYINALCDGAKLPVDDKDKAILILRDSVSMLADEGYDYDLSQVDLESDAAVANARHEVDDRLFQARESIFARNQSKEVDEIISYIDMLLNYTSSRRTQTKVLSNGKEITLPNGEGPAYLEWMIWRAFLAVNSLRNHPWDSRRFKIDQDFLPIGTAPGRGSDIIFEFDEFFLIVEVTLTSSSRQEAAEGEPVRRHMAQYAESYADSGKDVYGLFIAVAIDTNTANTFKLGEWYRSDDSKLALQIVPMTLSSFRELLDSVECNPGRLLEVLRTLLLECRAHSNKDAVEWKKFIGNKVSETSVKLKRRVI